MKTLTPALAAALAQRTGIRAMIILQVDWPAPIGTKYYGDKTINVGSMNVSASIAEGDGLSELASMIGPDYGAVTSSATVKLIDPGGLLYLNLIFPGAAIENSPVTVKLYVEGIAASDVLDLMSGVVGSPISYDEGERMLSFDIVAPVRSSPITYTLDQDLDASVPDESDGAVMPIAFGNPRDVPAVLYRVGPSTRILEDLDSSELQFEVDDSSKFPNGTLTLRVEDEMMTATVANDLVTASARNVAKFSQIASANRPSSDPDKNNPFVFYCQDASKDHVGNYVIINAADVPGFNATARKNLCVAQRGTRLTFQKPWTNNQGGLWVVPANVVYDVKRYAFDWVNTLAVNANQWTTQAGARVSVFKDSNGVGQEFADWIASSIPSSNVLRVRAYRTYQQGRLGITERRLVTVPPDLWSWSNQLVQGVDGSGTLVNVSATVIHFPLALELTNQGWDGSQIFVTLVSTVGSNPSDQIKYILQNKTTVVPNNASFSSAATTLSKYRADFAILDDADALDVCHDLAFQFRTALLILGATAKLRYLSKEPTVADFQLTNDVARLDTFRLSMTPVEDVKTVVFARWFKNYTGDDSARKRIRRRRNVNVFGAIKLERVFWAMQRRSLVAKSATFWANRFSRTWKLVEVEAELSAIGVEPFDIVSVQFPDTFIVSGVLGWVWEVHYSSDPHAIRLVIWLPQESGPNVNSSFAYLSDAGDSALPDPVVKTAKSIIPRIAPFAFSMISEPLQTAVPAKITKVLTAQTATIDLYPNGLANASSGSAFLQVLKIPTVALVVGGTGLVWQLPSGDYVSDVFAQ